jgi:hypothetical protein
LLLPGILRALADLSSVVVPDVGRIDVAYRLKRGTGRAVICGTSAEWSAETVVDLSSGEQSIAIDHQGAKTTLIMRKLASGEKESR